MDIIRVALGIVIQDGRCLVAQRLELGPFEGLWEFPGGKIEPKESSRRALARELEEEVGIVPQEVDYLTQIVHAYEDRKVALDVWRVNTFSGEARACENQPLQWVLLKDLTDLALLPASREILPFLKV